jgi:hypothetical protein
MANLSDNDIALLLRQRSRPGAVATHRSGSRDEGEDRVVRTVDAGLAGRAVVVIVAAGRVWQDRR